MTEADLPAHPKPEPTEAGRLFKEILNAERMADIKVQEAAIAKLWQLVAEWQNDEPSAWLQCMGEAGQRAAAFDWAGTEAAYERALKAAGDNAGLLSKTYDDLRAWHSLMGERPQALAAARSATEAARRLGISSMLSLRLQAEARLAIEAVDLPPALASLTEAFAAIGAGGRPDLPRANALILQADYFIVAGELEKAETDLTSAWEILRPHVEAQFAGGWQSSLASWWSATARWRTLQGDSAGAVSAWREAVARSRIVANVPQMEGPFKHHALAKSLRDLGCALQLVGDGAAGYALAESDAIRQKIGLPPLGETGRG